MALEVRGASVPTLYSTELGKQMVQDIILARRTEKKQECKR